MSFKTMSAIHLSSLKMLITDIHEGVPYFLIIDAG